MKIWIYINGAQEGPYELEELLDKPVDENTKVWFEGLPKWYPAGSLEELRPLFDGSLVRKPYSDDDAAEAEVVEKVEKADDAESEPAAQSESAVDEEPARNFASKYAPGRRYMPSQQSGEPCPPTYLGWTVFLTVCCCSPLSIGALVASVCVSSYYNSGKLDRARKASEVAAWLIMIAIALGMIPLILMSALFGD